MKLRIALLALGCSAGLALLADEAEAAPPAKSCSVVKDGLALVPDGARFVGHVDGRKAFKSRLYKDMRSMIERDLEARDGLKVLDKCDLKIEDIQELTVATGKSDETVAVIKARGLGKAKTLSCLRKQIAARDNGKQPWTIRRGACYSTLTKDNKDFAFVLDDSTIVVTENQWAGEVRALIDGKGKAAKDGVLRNMVGRVDRTHGAWFAGILDDQTRGQLSGSSFAGIREVGGSLDFDRGLDLDTVLQAIDPGAAVSLRDEMVMYRDMMKGAGMIPGHLLDRLHVSSAGSDVNVDLSLSFAELEEVRKSLEPYTTGHNPL
jgi:hypothetical protein